MKQNYFTYVLAALLLCFVSPAFAQVAKIGDTTYGTFSEAIAAAQAGQTITLIADVVEPNTVVLGKALKIDGAGHTFKGAIEFNKKSATYTIKNVNFDGEGTRVYALKTTSDANTLNVEDCTCTNYTYGFLFTNKATANLNVKNVTVEGVTYGVHSARGTNFTLDNYKAINTKYALYFQNYSARYVTLNNCTFEGCENLIEIIERNQTYKINFTFIGNNVFDKELPTNALFGYTNLENVTIANYVAKIGDKGYNSLAEAIAAATAGQTITLIADITGNVTIDKNLTIDGNGKNYTGTMNANNGLTVTVQNVNFVNGGFAKNNSGTTGTYTLKNCHFDGQGKYAYPVLAKNIGTLKVEDCTVEDYLYSFLYVKSQSTNVSVKNVSVEDCPNYAVYFASGVANATIEGLSVKNANNGIIWTNADKRTLSLKNCKMENVTTAIKHNGGTSIITVNAEGVNDFGGAGMSEYVKINGNVTGIGNPVAQIGDVKYNSLSDAFGAAQDGQTVTLLANIESSEIITIDKAITLDGNGKTLTSTAGRAINVETEGNVTINNLTINAAERAINIINEPATVTLNNVTATANNNAVMIATSAGAAKVTINGCNFTGLAVVNVAGAGAQVAINETNITNVDANKAENYGAITVYSTATNAKVTVTGGSITVADDSKKAYIFAEGATVTGVDQIGQIVAMIGDAGYETLTKAIADAKEGQTVKMVYNVTLSEILVINKPITLDGNGKTLTSTASRAINVETGGNVTINNLTINAAERAINIINEPATVTLNNVTATANNNAVMIATSAGAAKVTINGCNFTGLAVVNVAGAGAQVAINETNITNVDANKAENYGAITVYSTATDAKVTVTGGSITVADDSKKAYIFAEGATVTGVDQIGQIVAMIGDAGYETLTKAIADAKEGQTVKMVYNVTLSEILVIDKAITLDGNGKTLTSTAGRAINVSGADGVTIKDLTIDAKGERAINVIQNATNVTIDNVTATAANYTVNVAGSAPKAVVAINNSTLNGLCTVNVAAAGAKVTVDNSTVNCNDNNTTAGESYAALSLNKDAVGGSIVATNSTINVADGSDSMKGRNGAEKGTVTINGSAEGVAVMVAAITYPGSDYYHAFATLEKAIEFAKEGNVITLIRDVTMDYNARDAYETQAQNVVIDGNGKILTLNQKNSDWASFGLANNSKLVLKNMTIEKTGYGDTSGAWNTHAIIFSCPVEMTNVTVNNSVAVQAGATLNNVIINEANGYYGLWINGNGQAVTVNGGEINATNGGRGIKIADQYINAPAQVTLNVDGTVFKTAKKAAVLVSSTAGANITANDVNIENVTEDQVNFVWVDEDWAQYFANVQVTGATVKQEGIENFKASINGACYKTLAAAIEAAQAGQTITLIADITEDVTINKNLTIDGNDKKYTYTGTMSGNDNLTITVKNVNFVNGGFAKTTKSSKGVYTFVGCTFVDNGNYAYPLKIKGAHTINVENCTVKNYMYSFLYVYSAAINVSVKNVTVEDCPNYAVYFASGVANATIEGLSVKNANNGILINNTANRKLTIKDCQMENVTTAINHSGGTNIIEVNAEGANDFGGAAISKYVQINGTVDGISNPVAKIGETEYNSLSEAFAAAQDGETVTLIEDIVMDTKTLATQNDGYAAILNVAGKAVTLDLNGKNITVDAAAADLAGAKGGMLLAVFSADLGGHLTLTDNTEAKNGAVKLNVNDAKVYSMFASESGQSNKSNSGKITVNGGNYTTVGKVNQTMFFADANEVITVNGGNFHCDGASTSAPYPWMFNTVGNNELHVTVNGGTFNVDVNHQHRPFEVYVPETLAVKANGDGTWTVVPSVAYITEMLGGTVHEAGSRKHMVGYATLADAIEAAEDDEPVTLAADATGAGVVINKDVTIDFNGKTYTVNKAVGSEGTETLGFQILKGNDVTLENGTLTSTAVVEGNQVKMLIQNYANLSLVDMNLVDATDHILYVLSNNCGDSYVGGNTNITTDAVAFDSFKSKYYDAPMVTVETTGTIAGAIEKNDGATIAIMSGTFTAEILPEWCAEYYVPVQNEDGTWTVVNTYVEELTFVDGEFTKFENDIEKTVGTLTYKRKFNNFNWNVIYLPFEVPMAKLIDNYEVAYFYDVHSYDTDGDGQMDNNINVEVVKISKEDVTLKANYPYMIRAKNDNAKNLEIVLNDATLYPSISTELICQSVLYKFEIVGNHETVSHAQLNDGGLGLTMSGGKWGPMNEAASLKPWRVYLKIAKRSDAPWIDPETFDLEQLAVSMTVRDENGANGIENSKFELNVADSKYYDLMGRVVEHPVKGRIYIVNGKKVVY